MPTPPPTPPRITFVSTYNPLDRATFGGRMATAVPALRNAGLTLDLHPLPRNPALYRAFLKRQLARLGKQTFNIQRDPAVVRSYARHLRRHLQSNPADLILSPMSPGSQPIAYLNSPIPKLIWTDSTLAGWLDEHQYHAAGPIEQRNLDHGLANERYAMHNAELILFWSQWAADAAIQHYNLPPDRVGVLPSGPSVPACELHPDELISKRPADTCNLLFIGVNWRRKGGDIALDVVRILQSRNINTRLTLIGDRPPPSAHPLPPYTQTLGYISKSQPNGLRTMRRAFEDAHFLLLPSRNDCTPLVVTDACAHATPCIARNIGGMSSLVHNHTNGILIPPDAPASIYADQIQALHQDPVRYAQLVHSTHHDFHQRLSWPAIARQMTAFIHGLLQRQAISSHSTP